MLLEWAGGYRSHGCFRRSRPQACSILVLHFFHVSSNSKGLLRVEPEYDAFYRPQSNLWQSLVLL